MIVINVLQYLIDIQISQKNNKITRANSINDDYQRKAKNVANDVKYPYIFLSQMIFNNYLLLPLVRGRRDTWRGARSPPAGSASAGSGTVTAESGLSANPD